MPRLTQIKPTKQGRCALFFDGTFAFSLTPQALADAALHEGDELTEEQLASLRAHSDAARALDKALDLLALRDHAAGELRQKLRRRFDAQAADAAVARVGELGLLDDADVARRRAAELLRRRRSRREILRDLAQRGIDADTAAEAVAALYDEVSRDGGPDPELQAALALVQGPYARKLAEGKRDQVAAALARRGFGREVIRAALARQG